MDNKLTKKERKSLKKVIQYPSGSMSNDLERELYDIMINGKYKDRGHPKDIIVSFTIERGAQWSHQVYYEGQTTIDQHLNNFYNNDVIDVMFENEVEVREHLLMCFNEDEIENMFDKLYTLGWDHVASLFYVYGNIKREHLGEMVYRPMETMEPLEPRICVDNDGTGILDVGKSHYIVAKRLGDCVGMELEAIRREHYAGLSQDEIKFVDLKIELV